MDSSALIERVEEIATARLVYRELKDGGYNAIIWNTCCAFKTRWRWCGTSGERSAARFWTGTWSMSSDAADRKDAEQDYEWTRLSSYPDRAGVRMC